MVTYSIPQVTMPAVNQTPEKTVTDHRKTSSTKTFEVFETVRDSFGSSSDDMETYSPKSVVLKVKKWQDVKERRVVRNQIERIRAEDSHLGEDIFIAKVCGSGYDVVNVLIFSRPVSPLSGKGRSRIDMVQ